MQLYEIVLSMLVMSGLIISLYYTFKAKGEIKEEDYDRYSIQYLCEAFKCNINHIVNMDITKLNLNKKDLESRQALKRTLSRSIRRCSQGDKNAKMIVLARTKGTLPGMLHVTEDRIDEIIPFHDMVKLSPMDQFEIMMYLMKREGSRKPLKDLCKITGLGALKQDDNGYYYDVSEQDIRDAYEILKKPLSYDDKLNVLSQRVYQMTYGLSIVDMLIMDDESVDGVSGGISGITSDNYSYQEDSIYSGDYTKPNSYESVWIILEGKPIHMKFLSFGSNTEIIRICKNLAEYGRMGHITSSEGGIKTHIADGSRVTIFRPNNSTQWSFFVRKHTSVESYDLKDLITDQGCEYPIGVIEWGTKGCLNLFFSGDQNSGKTTNMRGAVRNIDRRQPIRTIEADFELYLNDVFYDKNIIGVRPSERLPFPKVIELLKASDAHTILFGETASLEHAKHLIDLLLAGTKRVITTGHWSTSEDLVAYFVHAMGGYGSSGTQELELMISRLLHLNIHHVKENDGHRRIDRITEIIPYEQTDAEPEFRYSVEDKLDIIAYHLRRMTRKKMYYTRDIIRYIDGEYRMINPISNEKAEMILRNLPPEERESFIQFNTVV